MTLTLAAWLHDLSPVIFKFTDALAIRWYGLAYALGFILGWLWLRSMSRRGMTPLSQQRIGDAMLILVLGVVLGGRLGYVFFYDPALLVEFTRDAPFWGVFKVNKGGMSSHGGILGVIVASWVVARGVKDNSGQRRFAVPWMHVLDLTAVACTVGLGLGRIANFINGELLGQIVAMPGKAAPGWAVKFPQERMNGDPLGVDPTIPVEHAPPLTPEQTDALAALLDRFRIGMESDGTAYGRMIQVLQKGGEQGEAVARDLAPLISARYPSQLMQAATDGLILGLALWLIWYKPRRPGVVGAWFMILYGVMRIATEFIRLPDPELAALKQSSGLSMGQWLSIAMIVVGIGALVVFRLRPTDLRYPGWLRKA
ncbi:MAG TPA: prolipoprotein diacylglyceryl transferase [Phycisphaerales bacterium]|nr:prolipoprotein diacylglyceryl transferase [Phycisphaerales bacterium]